MRRRNSYFVPRDEKERFSVQPFFFSKILSRDAFLLEGEAREQKCNPEIIFEKKKRLDRKTFLFIPRYELHFSVVRYENEDLCLVLRGKRNLDSQI